MNRYYLEHLKRDHYCCLGCGWVGIVPGQHVTRSPHHEGPVQTDRPSAKRIRISSMRLPR